MLANIMAGAALLDMATGIPLEEWQPLGRCARSDDPDLWFDPTEDMSPRYDGMTKKDKETARKRDRARAKEKCGACPVRAECLKYAMDNSRTELDIGQFGIWGGLDRSERTKLRNMLATKEVAA